MTHNVGAMITWSLFATEAMSAIHDLRWEIVFCIVLIATDFWWGWRENRKHYNDAKTEEEKKKHKFHFSLAGRRTLNKFVDYTTYLLLGCVTGMAVTEPIGICSHVVTAALGIGFGCLFEISSIVGHIAVVKGIKIKLNLKGLLVAIAKKKSEDLGEILDEGIEEIEDKRNKKDDEDTEKGEQGEE